MKTYTKPQLIEIGNIDNLTNGTGGNYRALDLYSNASDPCIPANAFEGGGPRGINNLGAEFIYYDCETLASNGKPLYKQNRYQTYFISPE